MNNKKKRRSHLIFRGFQGFIAYGCHGYIVIVDPNTLQVIQTLGQHKGNVSQVLYEPHCEKTRFLPMQKQRRRSASQ